MQNVLKERSVAVLILCVKIANKMRGTSAHSSIGINEIHDGYVLPLTEARLEKGPPRGTGFKMRVRMRSVCNKDVEQESCGGNSKEDPIAFLRTEVDNFDLLLSGKQLAELAESIMRGGRDPQLKMSGFAVARALDTKHALRGARGVLASSGLRDAHEVLLKLVELCTEQFDSSGRESRGGLSTMAKGKNVA